MNFFKMLFGNAGRDAPLTDVQWWQKLRQEARTQRDRDEVDAIFERHFNERAA